MIEKKRLQKIISEAGFSSRRKAEEYISQNRVVVNGEIAVIGQQAFSTDQIEIDGVPINSKEKKRYILLNKPRGVITTMSDEKGRKTIPDIIGNEVTQRIFPVGRLDFDTTGILLLTNDGDLANKLMHPKKRVGKTYIAKIDGRLTKNDIEQLTHGIKIDKSFKTLPAKVKILSENESISKIEITISEGKYHQVKKMFESIGKKVLKLTRVQYAGLSLDGLLSGQFRSLTESEIKRLKSLVK